MTDISIDELGQNLAAWLARAEAGETLIVTRHGRPTLHITTANQPHVVFGANFGKTDLRQVVRECIGEDALRVLDEDRRDRFDGPPHR